ncbi:hypothetical protein SAMD00024442_34_9 [Candidatus Symbiothrix dinenymphae]|nr:hypothetical protein SAMD00024442_34_9 [Candidatus Symbiothrix dinenymphae]
MKKTNQLLNLVLVALLSVSCTSKKAGTSSEWTNLLDEDLSQWRIYQKDIGYDVNEKNVFSVVKDNGELVLHNTGEIFGCIFTKQDFRNYHLKLQYKFGTVKYPPREDKARDSGILYHSQGEAGVDGYWQTWMLSQEFQVMEYSPEEGVSGDYYAMATAQVNVVGDATVSNRYPVTGNYTSPAGEWTTLELFCYEGKSLHVVNGKLALALENSSYRNGDELLPLVEGKIQLQSEAAEIFFKDIQIKEICELPEIK